MEETPPPAVKPKKRDIFDEAVVSGLVIDWKKTQNPETLKQAILKTLPLIDTLILHGRFTKYDELAALRNECVIKLHRLLYSYDPSRGKLFSLLSFAFKNFLISYVKKVKGKRKYHADVDETFIERVEGRTVLPETIGEDLKTRLMSVATRFSEAPYADIQRYLITYFIREGFDVSRSKMANSVAQSYAVPPDNAYFIYDYTLVQLRSVLLDMNDFGHFSDLELLRVSKRWSFLPELAKLIGMENFVKISNVFAGISVTFPSKKDIEKLRGEQRALTRINNEGSDSYTIRRIQRDEGGDPQEVFDRVHTAAIEGQTDEQELFHSEFDVERDDGYSRRSPAENE